MMNTFQFCSLSAPTKIEELTARLSVLLSLSELKENRIGLGISRQERVYDEYVIDSACEDVCVKVENAKTAKTR